ncbi:hypothetical protein MCOR02_011899 [Pyricularia oryzae]|nr:hypothetical protein MCOR02_011899 [Pyricularia oryzae]KAI6573591.1 hypothetical protein MCOR04_007369 [Pyricularia oryzae]
MTQLSTRRRVYAEAHMLIHDNERYFDDYMVHETHKPPRRLPGPGTAELRKLWLLRPKSTMIHNSGYHYMSLRDNVLKRLTWRGSFEHWNSEGIDLHLDRASVDKAGRSAASRTTLSEKRSPRACQFTARG